MAGTAHQLYLVFKILRIASEKLFRLRAVQTIYNNFFGNFISLALLIDMNLVFIQVIDALEFLAHT